MNSVADKLYAIRVIDKEIETLVQLRNSLDETISKTLDILENTRGRVILTGMGKSGIIGHKIAASLSSTGTPSFFVHPAEASHGDLGMITKDDVVIAISNSGESKELVDLLNYCKRFGIQLVGITKNENSSLGNACDIVLKLPNHGEACPLGLAPTNSTTATLVLGDVLTTGLMRRKGFTETEFNLRHPGGKLGSILKHVSDLMHTGNDMPLLPDTVDMQTALLEMTSKCLGCVGFKGELGNLTGMLTDGDLRRCISPNILTKSVKDVMTKNPKVIPSKTLASEALKIMSDKKITNLFVVEKGIPIGVIHIHDLLNVGIK